ncbi:MAG: ATP-binding protein [Bacteroidales bacterium]|nr:ATP-binding protein [Bacteroidales bacterium]
MELLKRNLQEIIEHRLFKGKAIVLVGARQVGKSTLFRQILSSNDDVLTLDCDDPETRGLLEGANLSEVRRLVGNHRIVMIDEAQRLQGAGLTMKLITDNMPNVQLLITGSSSFLLQGSLNEPLTGRKFEYQLYPFSTQEINDNLGYIRTRQLLESRLVYGSYPDVVNNSGDSADILSNLSGSYMYQDLLSLEGVRKPVIIEKLLVALALQVGSEVSYNELSHIVGSDVKTVEKYIDLLEKCYIVFRLPALSRNMRTELKKGKKVYFYDNGIRNAIIQNLNPLSLRGDVGALWENFIVSERIKYNNNRGHRANYYFWRTTTQQEIDLIEESGGSFQLFEMKWNPKKGTAKPPSEFIKSYGEMPFTVITPDNYLDFLT